MVCLTDFKESLSSYHNPAQINSPTILKRLTLTVYYFVICFLLFLPFNFISQNKCKND